MKTLLKKTILIAEDDEGISDSLSQLLKSMNYKVEQVSDGLKIVSRLKKILPDLLLLDVTMPGTDGREVCKELKNDKLVRHIPIILMSANSNVKSLAKEVRAEDFMAKPFDIFDLLHKIKKLLNVSLATSI